MKVVSNTPNTGYLFSSPRVYFQASPGVSTSLAAIYLNAGNVWENLRIDSPISSLATDPHQSKTWIELNGAFGDDGAQGHLGFLDSNGTLERIKWDNNGVQMTQGPIGSQVSGNALLSAGLTYRVLFNSVYSGTTNGSGQLTLAHTAPFTPAYGFVMPTSGNAYQLYIGSITSTNFTVTAYSPSGALLNATFLNFWVSFLGG
jgi:hypothetical protein